MNYRRKDILFAHLSLAWSAAVIGLYVYVRLSYVAIAIQATTGLATYLGLLAAGRRLHMRYTRRDDGRRCVVHPPTRVFGPRSTLCGKLVEARPTGKAPTCLACLSRR